MSIRYLMSAEAHQLTLVMEADPDYISNKIAAEDEKLKSTPIPEHIVEEAQALGEAQEKPQDTRCLPTLHTSDIPPENPNECTDITVDVPRRRKCECWHTPRWASQYVYRRYQILLCPSAYEWPGLHRPAVRD